MNLRNYLIRVSLILFISFSFTEKSLSVEPDQFIQSIADEASKVLISNISKEQKTEKLKSIALKSVDIKGIGLYSLGSHRKNLSDDEKEKYSELFKKYLEDMSYVYGYGFIALFLAVFTFFSWFGIFPP